MSSEERLSRMRRALMRLVLGVVLVDLVAIGIYLVTDVRNNPRILQIMTVGWLAVTLAVVLPNLRAIRRIRNEVRGGAPSL